MPGAKFKRQAAVWYQYVMDLTHVPYAAVKKAMVCEIVCARSPHPLTLKSMKSEGTAAPSVVATLLNKLDPTEDNTRMEDVIRDVAGAAYTGMFTIYLSFPLVR